MIYSITILLNIQKKACLKVTSRLCNQFLSNSISIVFNFRAGFGDVQSMIVKIAHAKRKKFSIILVAIDYSNTVGENLNRITHSFGVTH